MQIANYLNYNLNKSLEGEIYETTDDLLMKLDEFSKIRDGADDTTKALPIKIRQQIYGFLGNLGFADIIKNEKQEHHFISEMKNWLNNEINKLRIINDPQKK